MRPLLLFLAVLAPALPAVADDTPPEALGHLELLPPSAFPEPRVRGIPDGSLAGTMHGLQWPYFPKSGIAVSGSAWVDSGYEHIERGNPTERSIDYWLQQGRVLLRVTPTYSDGSFFVQGQAELIANKDQSLRQPDVADTDDLWIKVGGWKRWDLQLGRFEGWEVYHFGMGLDLNTLERQGASSTAYSAPEIYGVTYAFYRPAGVGQAALHYYPRDWFRVELGSQIGNEFGANTLAARPVAVVDLGWLKLKAGAEYKRLTDQTEGAKGDTRRRGAGGAVELVLAPHVELGISGAAGIIDRIAQDGAYDEKGSNTTWSVGGFANARLVAGVVLGLGVNYTFLEDVHMDPALGRVQQFNQWQSFAALQYVVAKRLYIKAVAAYAQAAFAPNFGAPVFENQMLSGRVRLLYVF
jgi:hypothetical protein